MSASKKLKVARRKTQTRPVSFLYVLSKDLAQRSKRAGYPIRVSAEEAISHGVHREYLFHKNGSLRVNAVHVFSSEKGSIDCAMTKRISLDMVDNIDPARWGIWRDIELEDVANLMRWSFELDPAAFDREDDRFVEYSRQDEYDRYYNDDSIDDADDGRWSMAA